MAQPIGKRIIETVELLESLGPSTTREVEPHMLAISKPNTGHLLSRAYSHGLATWEENSDRKRVYTAVPGWKLKLRQAEPKPAPTETPKRFWQGDRPMITSVFALGINPFNPNN